MRLIRSMVIVLCSVGLTPVALVSTGCETSRQPLPVDATPASSAQFELEEATTEWPYWPTTMRIHPLTRIVRDRDRGNGAIIEARIEFSDQFGTTTRGAGQLRLELVDLVEGGALLEEWNNDLRSLASNELHFDDITRTYLFRLELRPELDRRQIELRAYFLSIDGSRLAAQYELAR